MIAFQPSTPQIHDLRMFICPTFSNNAHEAVRESIGSLDIAETLLIDHRRWKGRFETTFLLYAS